MDYNEIDVDQTVNKVVSAVEQGKTRSATKQEIMRIRLAALSAIVKNMQEIVEKDHEIVSSLQPHV